MNRTLAVVSALGVGLSTAVFTASAMAQAAPAAGAPAAAAVKPEAIPAKIAVLAFESAVANTNEGIQALQEIQKKYAPTQAKVQSEGTEVDALRKQLEALPATAPDTERQSRAAAIDVKEKQLNLDLETAQNQYQADMQEALGKVAQKVSPLVTKYLQANGYTMMLSLGNGNQPSDVMWFDQKTDITQAIVEAYNASSGVAAPLPAAPAAGAAPAAARPRPASTAPRPAPKPAAK
jgi:outer membrane protein